jgi:hypothetical protein
LLTSKVAGNLRNAARGKEIPFHVETVDVELPAIPRPGDNISGKKRVETWPALDALCGLFEQLRNDVASIAVQSGFGVGD